MKPLEEMGKFATVVIDPPWHLPMIGFSKHGYTKTLPYDTMSIAQIAEMPIGTVLDEHALCFCWATTSTLPDVFGILAAWGLQYSFTMTWMKGGGTQFPNTPCYNTEFIVVGKIGSPRYVSTKAFRAGNYWPRGAHSEKPEGFYDLLRRVTLGPRLDIFGRRRIAGFTSWGNEAPESEALPDHYQEVML